VTPTARRSSHESRRGDAAWKQETIWSVIQTQRLAYGDHEAIVGYDDLGGVRRLSYSQLHDEVEQVSIGLHQLGVRRGDRVGILMTNTVEWILVHFAGMRLGATTVPVSTRLKDSEVEYVLTQSRTAHLVMLESFRRTDYTDVLKRICPEWAESMPGQIRSARLPELKTVIVVPTKHQGAPPQAYNFKDIAAPKELDQRREVEAICAEVEATDAAIIKYTSGSTGFPKGAVLEQWGIAVNARLHARRLEIGATDRWFSAMPFFHAGGSVWGMMTMLVTGGTLVFQEVFNAAAAISIIESEACTVHYAVSAMLRDEIDLLKERGRSISGVRLCSRGNDSLEPEVRKWFGSLLAFSSYGTTESYGPNTTLTPHDPPAQRMHGQGRFLEGIEWCVKDPNTGLDVSSGIVGECWIRGLVMRGYYGDEARTTDVIDENGWLHTQDLISVDPEGYVTYVGRLKAMLKVGGENVSVEEVEDCIRAFSGVAECCVIGVPDPRLQEIPRAYIQPHTGHSIDVDSLRKWCSSRMAPYKVPRDFVIVRELPTTGPGKVDRAAVVSNDPDASALTHIQAGAGLAPARNVQSGGPSGD
jgi:fatty-acyl-CoA synthase